MPVSACLEPQLKGMCSCSEVGRPSARSNASSTASQHDAGKLPCVCLSSVLCFTHGYIALTTGVRVGFLQVAMAQLQSQQLAAQVAAIRAQARLQQPSGASAGLPMYSATTARTVQAHAWSSAVASAGLPAYSAPQHAPCKHRLRAELVLSGLAARECFAAPPTSNIKVPVVLHFADDTASKLTCRTMRRSAMLMTAVSEC